MWIVFWTPRLLRWGGAWRVHCVTASACCDCRIAIPMGEKGSLLDINVETTKRSYFTKLITPPNDEKDSDRVTKAKDGFMMKRNTYTLKIPQVEGGSIIHVKVRWSQKLLYEGDDSASVCRSLSPRMFYLWTRRLQK
ncbi:hypothetical protein HanIR_Chr10g0494211 [Helianthus annuus]|nr:hypothetical protein HanIR_Chr10g0494211 [Helianthus annuus]